MAEDSREAVERFWQALEREDFDAAAADLHDDVVEEWPQSGERIVGKQNWLGVVNNYPGFPRVVHLRTVGEGDVWTSHCSFDYSRNGSPPWHVCAVQECRDGKIARITEFFGAPFEPAEWRAQWIERAGPGGAAPEPGS